MTGVFDVGNSYTKLIVFSNDEKIIGHWKFQTNNLPIENISILLNEQKIKKIIIGSVVLNKEDELFNIAKSLNIDTTIISKQHFWNVGFKSLCSKEEIGLDILALSFYLSTLKKEFLSISFGTLTFASLYYDDCLQGVSIAPNLNLNDYNMFTNVSLINNVKVKLDSDIKFGKNTNDAISSGIIHYYQGFINSLYKAASLRMKVCEIFITGGNPYILKKIKFDFNLNIDEFLVSKGYYFIEKFFLNKAHF